MCTFSLSTTACPAKACAAETNELDAVLTAAESLFQAMKQKNYPAIWNHLSAGSRDHIIDITGKSSKKVGVEYSREQIATDFKIGGLISRSYWNSYLCAFDPDIPLENSKWDMEFIKDKTAVIRIQYKKAPKPALLQMYKEEGAWRVGLEETFGSRKWLIK